MVRPADGQEPLDRGAHHKEDGAAHRDPEHRHADMCILYSCIQEAAMASFTSLFVRGCHRSSLLTANCQKDESVVAFRYEELGHHQTLHNY